MRLPKALRLNPRNESGAVVTVAPPAALDPAHLDADRLKRLIKGGTDWLERNAAAVNALNVFPVPDGDTGTNMLLTMRAAVEGGTKNQATDTGAAMHAIAQGAVMGARGNSGVILSQIIAGIARGIEGTATVDGATLASGLQEGAATAYRAVTRPVEGTILTVARAAGDGVLELLRTHAAPSCATVLDAAIEAAQLAVERTPEQLPILRQAGVVDAGGEGYRLILEGMAMVLRGDTFPETPSALTQPAGHSQTSLQPPVAFDVDAIGTEEWGYCTQFVIKGERLNMLKIRDELQVLAASALVVGDDELVRVHGHTEDPGQLLTYAVKFGRLDRISIEDMDAQHDDWLRAQTADVEVLAPPSGATGTTVEPPMSDLAVVAVSPGPGLSDVFKSLGTSGVIAGGQTMNPSAHDVLEAARRTRARAVLILPNNGNVVMTAQQAAQVAEEHGLQLLVVPTKTVPQGIAAQLAFDAGASAENNARMMADAAHSIRTVEITRATRSVTLDELEVQSGDTLGLVDDKVVSAGPNATSTALRALEIASARTAEVVTLYRGADVSQPDAEAFANGIRSAFPHLSVELVVGGQPHYDYLISVE